MGNGITFTTAASSIARWRLPSGYAPSGADDASAEKSCLAFRALGSTLMSKGEFVRAIEAFDGAITRGNQASLGTCFAHHGEEPHIVALQYKGLSLAVRGHADTGLATAQSALSLARTLNFPLMVAFASTAVGMVLMLRREYRPCAALVREQIEFCSEQGFIFWSAAHEILHGASQACLDRDPRGVAQLEQGIRKLEEDRRRAAHPDLVVLSRRGRALRRRS